MSKTFVLAPDSFKESMTALEACAAMQQGIYKVYADARFLRIPMADGGEGTVDAILTARFGKRISLQVMGPLPTQRVRVDYALIDDGQTAVIEMAQANGIQRLPVQDRNPMLTSSYGAGEMIRAALDQGVSKIIVGIGGSVTNDAGMGMAQALGAQFFDAAGSTIGLGANQLSAITQVDLTQLDPRLRSTEMVIASDVNNPLTGSMGASHIFAPQKGASPEMVLQLDQALSHFANVIHQQLGLDLAECAGAGAAGGVGYALMVFAQGHMRSGIETVIEMTHLKQAIVQADYVFTGEGAIDAQTVLGKTPYGVARLAKSLDKPVIACAGKIGEGAEALYAHGVSAMFSIVQQSCRLEDACLRGAENLEKTCENIARILQLD